MSGHVMSMRAYLGVFLALMVLTAVTASVAFLDLGILNDVVALGIAGTKAVLVILYFMHLRHSSRMVKVFLIAAFCWLLMFFVLILADYLTRIPVTGWAG